MTRFGFALMERAKRFLKEQDKETRQAIGRVITEVQESEQPDRKKFKPLKGSNIWEFRIPFKGIQYRLFAFKIQKDGHELLVIATHGIVKKDQKVRKSDIQLAEELRKRYLDAQKE